MFHRLGVRENLRGKRGELLPDLADGEVLARDVEVFALFLE